MCLLESECSIVGCAIWNQNVVSWGVSFGTRMYYCGVRLLESECSIVGCAVWSQNVVLCGVSFEIRM